MEPAVPAPRTIALALLLVISILLALSSACPTLPYTQSANHVNLVNLVKKNR